MPRRFPARNKRTTDRYRSATELHSPARSREHEETHVLRKRQHGRNCRAESSRRSASANTGYALGYGNDEWTRRVEQRFAEIFEREVAVFLVPTGTVANALALAHLIAALGRGAVPCGVACRDRRMRRAGIFRRRHQAGRADRARAARFRPRRCAPRSKADNGAGRITSRPRVLSLSQATECGTIYRVAEIRELADIAHASRRCACTWTARGSAMRSRA